MISWIVILTGLLSCAWFTNLHTTDTLYSVWAPFGCVIFSIAFLFKLVLNYSWARGSGYGSSTPGDSDDGGY